MFDLPNWFWNTLAIIVFIAVNFILWLHCRRCKAKGIDPQPPFNRFKKHEKRISRWTDIFIIIIILLETIACGYAIYAVTNSLPQNISFEYQQDNSQLTLSVGLLLLLIYSASAITMASLLSAYQRNLTVIKRLELLVMCCTPLLLGILYCVVDNSHNYRFYFKLLLGSLFSVVFINWPAILLGRSFCEFYPALLRKIPLPWFQFSEQEEKKSD